MEARPHPRPRFWIALQPSIVRVYKVAGLIALTAILVGLIGFLTVNIFYFFDKSWVRPVVIDRSHEKVIALSSQIAEVRQRQDQLANEKLVVEAELARLDRVVATDDKFVAEVGPQVDAPRTPEQWLLRREVDRAKLDRDDAIARRQPLGNRRAALQARIDEQADILKRLQQSPYFKAIDHPIVLAFVPYKNLRANVKEGTELYSCQWGLLRCSVVGKVTAILDGEVTGKHPHDDSLERGQFVEIDVPPSAAGDAVLFAGGKPLWLF